MMHRGVCLAVVVAALVTGVRPQKPFWGRCPQQNVEQNFDLNAYLGKWYEVQKYFAIFELGAKCVTAEYSLKDENTVKVLNSQVNILTNKPSGIEGEAILANPGSGEGKLSVAFFGSPSTGEGNYWVLDTDYTSYTLVWTCNDYRFFNTQILWLLFRDQVPDQQLLSYVRNLVRDRGLDLGRLKVTDQTNCPAGTK